MTENTDAENAIRNALKNADDILHTYKELENAIEAYVWNRPEFTDKARCAYVRLRDEVRGDVFDEGITTNHYPRRLDELSVPNDRVLAMRLGEIRGHRELLVENLQTIATLIWVTDRNPFPEEMNDKLIRVSQMTERNIEKLTRVEHLLTSPESLQEKLEEASETTEVAMDIIDSVHRQADGEFADLQIHHQNLFLQIMDTFIAVNGNLASIFRMVSAMCGLTGPSE